MAEGFIEEIYSKSTLLMEMELLVEAARERRKHIFVLRINKLLPILGDIAKEWVREDYDKGVSFWNSLEKVGQIYNDLIAYGDQLKNEIIPRYKEYLDRFTGICVDDEQGMRIQSSKSGFLTIVNTTNNKLIHSNDNPMWEAYIQAKMIYNPNIRDYYVLGAGLGYLPYQLYVLSEGTAKIHIFELCDKFLQYGNAYGVLEWIPKELLETVESDSIIPFLGSIQKGEGYYISENAIDYVKENEKNVLLDLIVNYSTANTFSKNIELNCCCNFSNVRKNIDDFDTSKLKKQFIVVAAGPSLDEQLDYLREVGKEKTIISVGTVFAKLIKNGIRPDAVAVMDPQERTFGQVADNCDENIPMFLGSSAHHLFAEKYKGEKYIIATEAINDLVNILKTDIPSKTYFCGSTVTTLAVRCAIVLGAEEIELIGVDLAYPGERTHASETMDDENVNRNGMVLVDDVNGNKVYTSLIFKKYISELEGIIKENKRISFYNLSNSGAKINGAKRRA